MKKLLSLSTLALAAAMLITGCSRGKNNTGGAGVPVLVALAFTTNVPVKIDPPPVGHVMAYSTVTVHSQIQGMISQIHFQEGQEVKKGDLLFSIDPRPEQAALDQARADLARDRAQLENARIQFDREQKLFDQKLVSQDDYDTSKSGMDTLVGTVQADEAGVTNAMLNLNYTEIRSPIDGVTGSLQSYVGNVVKAPDDTLVTINQIHPIYVAFGVDAKFLPEIKRETRDKTLQVAVTFENMDLPPPQGKLTFVDNQHDPAPGDLPERNRRALAGTIRDRGTDTFGFDEHDCRAIAGGANRTKWRFYLRRESGPDRRGAAHCHRNRISGPDGGAGWIEGR